MLGKISHANATVRRNRNQKYYDQASWCGTRTQDFGVLMNQALHNLDLLLWMMSNVEEVFSIGATRLRNIEAEDVFVGVVKFTKALELVLALYQSAVTNKPVKMNFQEE